MMGQEDFLDGVRDLMRLAAANGNHLTRKEIDDYFSDMNLSDQQLEYICKYLETQDVHIDGRVRTEQEEMESPMEWETESEHDAEMVRIYKKEAAKARSLTPDQEYQLVYKMTAGDQNARNLLIEANLALAMKLAADYRGRGLMPSDLIQEGNIGLMIAVNSYEPEVDGPFEAFKERVIRQQIETALEEYSHSTRSARKMASRVNELNQVATVFAREYEREPSARELAERMGITEEQVKELMKVSLDAIAILDQGKIG